MTMKDTHEKTTTSRAGIGTSRTFTHSVPLALAAILLFGSLAAAAPEITTPAAVVPVAVPGTAPSDSDSGNDRNETVSHYALDTTGLAEEAARTGALVVRGAPGEQLTLALSEWNLFMPGQKKVVVINEDSTTTETPYLGRTFQGTVAGVEDSRASMLIAPEGLYGSIEAGGKLWSFQRSMTQDPADAPLVTQEVISYNVPTAESTVAALDQTVQDALGAQAKPIQSAESAPDGVPGAVAPMLGSEAMVLPNPASNGLIAGTAAPWLDFPEAARLAPPSTAAAPAVFRDALGMPASTLAPFIDGMAPATPMQTSGAQAGGKPPPSASGQSTSGSTSYFYAVKPYADQAYTSYAGDWANRMTSAFNQGMNMWSSETQITVALYGLTATTFNFAPHSPCQSGDNDGGLAVFKQWIANGQAFAGPNTYALFEAASDMGSGVGGCAWNNQLDYNWRHGQQAHKYDAAFVVNSRDWRTSDSYNPNTAHDLGIDANHEMTHLAGEPDHYDNGSSCNFNIMSSFWYAPYYCKNFWRVPTTISRVKNFAYPYM